MDHRLDVSHRAVETGAELCDRLEPQRGLQAQSLQDRRPGFVNDAPLARHHLSGPIQQFQVLIYADTFPEYDRPSVLPPVPCGWLYHTSLAPPPIRPAGSKDHALSFPQIVKRHVAPVEDAILIVAFLHEKGRCLLSPRTAA